MQKCRRHRGSHILCRHLSKEEQRRERSERASLFRFLASQTREAGWPLSKRLQRRNSFPDAVEQWAIAQVKTYYSVPSALREIVAAFEEQKYDRCIAKEN